MSKGKTAKPKIGPPVSIPAESIERGILLIRGQRVMLDADLAKVFGVTTKRLNQQLSRNIDRFPEDFVFQLTQEEFESLRLQIATSKIGRGGRRTLPYAFTEHGAVMAANVLNTPIAVAASIQVVRAFVRLRQMLASNAELARKLDELEAKYAEHDQKLIIVFDVLRQLMTPTESKRRPIGFLAQSENKDETS
jgi:hypothetical protein